jgi:nitrite reductase/ring-hydroxylating ferredoxin subunit
MDEALIPLCRSGDLVNSGLAVPFDVVYAGATCRAFAVRFDGQVHAYLNRCTHVAMEMDYHPTVSLMRLGAG